MLLLQAVGPSLPINLLSSPRTMERMVQNILQNNEGSLYFPTAAAAVAEALGIAKRIKTFSMFRKLFEYHIEAISSYSVERERDMVNQRDYILSPLESDSP